jgi:hypothetical protein
MDWSETEVKEFIADQINYYGFEVSPEQSKEGISPWKLWLWLEKNGFDFAYVSLELEIDQFRIKEPRSVVPLESERRLLLAVRDVMRDILSLPPLDADARARLLSTVPIGNRTHWASVRRPYGNDLAPSENADFSDVIEFIWDFMERDRPDYVRLLRDIKRHDATMAERFTDNHTINGAYELRLAPIQKRRLYAMVTRHHWARAFDAFFGLGNLRFHDSIGTLFIESVEDYLARG